MGISAALGSSALLPAGLGFRNKLMNGDMRIAQRGTSAITGSGGDQWAVDRWLVFNGTGTVTFQQSTTAPAGFTNSIVATVTATGSYGTGGYTSIVQRIEGYNVADCSFGTASAKQLTLSFWVRASVTGTYTVSFSNSAGNRFLYRSFSVASANTWEYKTVNFVADSSGTWLTDNGIGLVVSFQLGRGTNNDGTENTWSSSTILSTSGSVDFAANSGATFYVTGVQLEQNYQPTPFEQRPYGVELQLCQRYYWKWTPSAIYAALQNGITASTTTVEGPLNHGYMRVAPSVDAYSTLSTNDAVAQNTAITAVDIPYKGNPVSLMRYTVGSAVLTTYRCYNILANNSTSAYLALTAEL